MKGVGEAFIIELITVVIKVKKKKFLLFIPFESSYQCLLVIWSTLCLLQGLSFEDT